jgi:hypothetical protein
MIYPQRTTRVPGLLRVFGPGLGLGASGGGSGPLPPTHVLWNNANINYELFARNWELA